MDVTVTIDDEVMERVRQRAQSMHKSVDQLISEYLQQLAQKSDGDFAADEFERVFRSNPGDSRGWKFNREEIHER